MSDENQRVELRSEYGSENIQRARAVGLEFDAVQAIQYKEI
ncbi:MAG TPA: hypothetical protein PLD17_06800 [Flavobacteriales bacterium]|nr:hypothetical protein [Flavobacteriales bacterium]HQX29286.1 hypothetical protein [Flavobacteriales bacterium]HQX37885.1 hypothetical protein [Flavobacteriales bacterium]HQZ91978.1 hypothetical protein [Flavobacteriales bacterium]